MMLCGDIARSDCALFLRGSGIRPGRPPNYPRKPRGIKRHLLGESINRAGASALLCSRRLSAPHLLRSVFRVAGFIWVIALITALQQGLTPARRQRLIDELNLRLRTLPRRRVWWTTQVSTSGHWRSLAGLLFAADRYRDLAMSTIKRLVFNHQVTNLVILHNVDTMSNVIRKLKR